MHHTTMISSLIALASLASAIPTQRDTYHGVSIEVQTSYLTDPVVVTSPAPVELYHLTICSSGSNGEPCSAAKLSISPNVHPNVNINAVECRAYKDVEGMQPGSAPFNVTTPALLSTNLVDIRSIFCYVVATK